MALQELLGRLWHQSLYGGERLLNVGRLLEQSCPWTRATPSLKMLEFLTSECKELEEEIQTVRHAEPGSNENLEITKELGDIIFDTMLLAIACKREFAVDLERCLDLAAQKVERRTPYMVWGTRFTRGVTLEQAEVMWQEEKALAKTVNTKPLDSLPRRYFNMLLLHKTEIALLSGLCFGILIGRGLKE